MGRLNRGWLCAAGLALALATALPCGCVHEELRPLRETTLSVARAGGEVTLSFFGTRGIYYTVMYASSNGARARWQPLTDAVNIQVSANGEQVIVKDRILTSEKRYYRLEQTTSPVQPMAR